MMASKFEIFEDQENFEENKNSNYGELKREKSKLMPLATKDYGDENISEQIQKAGKSETIVTASLALRAFKDKNVFQQKDEGKVKLKDSKVDHEESMISVASESWTSTDYLDTSSFTYRKDLKQDENLATPMSVEPISATPMSVDKSVMEVEQMHKSQAIKNDRDRFFDVIEYQKDILKYLKIVEVQKNIRPSPNYMKKQTDINENMRSILVDWLVEVSEEYRLHSETLCLAVHYIDRFLSYMSVVRAKLQLVGTTAMFVASKYEEIYPPEITEFVYITDDTYTKQQVLRMEKLLLKVLSFDLNSPSSYCFINLYASMMNMPEKVKFMAQYLCELSLLRALPFLNYTPSMLSAAAVALSYYTVGNSIWNKKMQETFNYELEDLKEAIVNLNEIHFEAESLQQQAIQEKFKANKYMQVSSHEPKKITADEIEEILAKINGGDELNTTAENIESVRQKTELLLN